MIVFCTLARGFLLVLPLMMITKQLGFGRDTDAYLMAVSVNAIILKLTRISTFSNIFIMIFSEDYIKNKNKMVEHVSTFFNLILLVSSLIAGAIYISAPLLVNIIAVGFSADRQLLTVHMLRIMSPVFVYYAFNAFFESLFALNNKFKLWVLLTLVSPLIVSVAVFLGKTHLGIYSNIYGTLAGCAVHLIILSAFIRLKLNYRYRLHLNLKYPLLRKIPNLIYPYYFSTVVVQGMQMVQNTLVSSLSVGYVSVFLCVLRVKSYIEDLFRSVGSQLIFPYFNGN